MACLLGVTQAIQNAGLGAMSVLAGKIIENDETYVNIELFYIGWLVLSILTTGLLWFLEWRSYKYLFMSDKQRKKFEQTPEYFKLMKMEMQSHLKKVESGLENRGFDN